MLGQFQKAGVPPKRKLTEFRVTGNALLPVGTTLNAAHFVPGQYVDVCSKRCVCVCVLMFIHKVHPLSILVLAKGSRE